jgi:hypoxanthine phosphoribosyltransferase
MFDKVDFVSHSGLPLTWKIECDALTDSDIECLAYMISQHFSFGKVVGVPRGGLRLAKALEPYHQEARATSTLIVDDVLTTGNSMERIRQTITGHTVGVVIFSRMENPPVWIHPVFQFKLGWSAWQKNLFQVQG